MHLGTVRHSGQDKVVVVRDEATLVDLSAAFTDMVSLVESGPAALERVRDLQQSGTTIATADVAMRCPISPVQYRDCLVFEQHLINGFRQAEKLSGRKYAIPDIWYDQPIYYKGNRMSFIGDGQTVIWPAYSEHMDFELELAIVVGKTGKDITAQDASEHIFGYTILNDVSSRDAQFKEMPGQLGPAKGKDFDTGNILGPWIVTADEVPHPAHLKMDVSINDERWGGGNSSEMHHDFGAIIEHISASETLYAGEVIGSGTVGTGCGLELGRQLSNGDRMTMTVEKIGTLTNTIEKP